jgi:putative transposase
MLNLSYEYKLKPTKEQILEIERTLIICRKVWNYALRERKDWINSRKCPINACSIISEYIIPADPPYPNYFVQAAGLTKAKEIYPELKTVNAQVLQQVLRKLETTFVDMKRKGMGFPRFKNRYRMRSFMFPQMLKNCIQGNIIKLPQLGVVEFIRKGWDVGKPRQFIAHRNNDSSGVLTEPQWVGNLRNSLSQRVALSVAFNRLHSIDFGLVSL